MEVVRKRVTDWPKARLQQEGYAVFDLSMQPEGFLFKYVSQSGGPFARALGHWFHNTHTSPSHARMRARREQILCFFPLDKSQKLPVQVRFGAGDVLAMSSGDAAVVEGEAVTMGVVLERSRRFLRIACSQETATRVLDAGQTKNWR
jgi:hypothetical protein